MAESPVEMPKTISFKQVAKELKDITPGTIITGVKPQDLWTTQNWIDTQKVQNALNKIEKDTYPSIGYIGNQNGKDILVLGDGNTKSIIAWIRGETTAFKVEGNLPLDTKIIPLRTLKHRCADLFTGFEYS